LKGTFIIFWKWDARLLYNLMITFLIESWTAEHAVSLDVPFMWVISCQMPNGFMSMMYIRSGSCAGDWILEVSS
jgi:hypothetical protein